MKTTQQEKRSAVNTNSPRGRVSRPDVCDKCSERNLDESVAHVQVGREQFTLCRTCAPELFTPAQGGPTPMLEIVDDIASRKTVAAEECERIGSTIHDATQKLVVLEAALDNTSDRIGETNADPRMRDARDIVVGVIDELYALRQELYEIHMYPGSKIYNACNGKAVPQ